MRGDVQVPPEVMTASAYLPAHRRPLLLAPATRPPRTAECRPKLKQQDQQCQVLAEKLAAACPGGTNIKETAQCRELSTQIASTCTRKPCAPPPRKGKKAKRRAGMGSGMG